MEMKKIYWVLVKLGRDNVVDVYICIITFILEYSIFSYYNKVEKYEDKS